MNEKELDFSFNELRKPREKKNIFIPQEEYRKIQESNPQWYPNYKRPKPKEIDIEEVAFLGQSTNPTLTYPDKTIPYGDSIRESFQVDNIIYHRTDTGYFSRIENTIEFTLITKDIFESKKPFKKVFNSFKKSLPQAGLTRGSKWTNLEPQKDKKIRLSEIQSRYLEGVV